MKTRFLKVQLLFMTLLISMKLSAGAVYPIVLNPQLLPPYSNCLLDYAASKRFNVFALSRDMNHASYSFILSIKMKQGNSYLINEKVTEVSFQVNSGIPTIVDITPLLNHVKDIKGNGFRYEEGAYEFVFQAFDANNPNIAVSEPAYLLAYLSQSEPPVCIYPNDNDCISPITGGVINFSWTESVAAMPDPSRKFKLEIYEMPDGIFNDSTDYSTRQRKARLNSLVETQVPIFSDETNVPFYTFVNTSGRLQKNHTYLWRVRIFKDGSNPDGKYTTSDYYKNGGWSEPFTLRYRNCNPWSQVEVKQEMRSNEEAPDLKVEVADVVTISWETDTAKYCGYRVGYNVKDQDSTFEWTTQRFAKNESSWVISKNIARGVNYEARIEGITNCSKSDSMYTEPKKADFKLDYKANNDCMSSVPALSNNENIASLEKGDIIDACGKTVRLTEVTRNDDGSFTGFGVVTLPALPDLAGIKVEFKEINVNTAKELTKGQIESTKGNNPITFNLNGLVNKQNAGTKTALQNNIAESKHAGSSSTSVINVVGNIVSISGSPLGTIFNNDSELNGIDDNTKVGENGKVTFANINGIPIIDEGLLPFGHGIQFDSYYDVSGQWIALEEGKSAKISAQFTKDDGTTNRDNISFYIQAQDDAVKIENIKWDATNRCEFTIFAGKNEKHLNLIAVDKSGDSYNILGRAFIQSMKRQEFKLHLVPVRRDPGSIKDNAISEKLNAIYNPLGKYFDVQVDPQFDQEKKLEFLDDGLDVSETSFLNLESEDMKQLTQTYIENNPDAETNEDAYIFICPSAQDPNVKGDMPRNKRMGYVFSNAEQFGLDTDPWTIAHELGHGLFDLEHTFEFNVAKNTTTNLMDYKQGTDTKVWQWTVMDNHHDYTLPFLEDAEDSQWTTDGHYYLFTYLGLLLGLDYETAEMYGRWAEEPDTHIDSQTGTAYENTTWRYGKMQQQNHALTSGYHGVELAATLFALEKAKNDPYYITYNKNEAYHRAVSQNCNLFLFHRFGDCFAHSDIKESYIKESDLPNGINNQTYIDALLKYINSVYTYQPNQQERTITYDKENKIFYTSFLIDEFTQIIVSSLIYACDLSLINDKYPSNTLSVIRDGILGNLPDSKVNKAKMYGGDVGPIIDFTLGHAWSILLFTTNPDAIAENPKLFKYYTSSSIDLLCNYGGVAGEKDHAFKSVASVVDWASSNYGYSEKDNVRLDGIFAFLIAYERAKQKDSNSKTIKFSIPVKHMIPENSVDDSYKINFCWKNDIINSVTFDGEKEANSNKNYLIDYINYCKDNKCSVIDFQNCETIRATKGSLFVSFIVKFK